MDWTNLAYSWFAYLQLICLEEIALWEVFVQVIYHIMTNLWMYEEFPEISRDCQFNLPAIFIVCSFYIIWSGARQKEQQPQLLTSPGLGEKNHDR